MKPKTHRRWTADPNVFNRVIKRIQPFTEDELTNIELPLRLAFDAMRNGHGTERDWNDLAAAINVVIIRSEQIDPLCEETAMAAANALSRSAERFKRTGKWGFDGPALAEIDAGLDLHGQLCRLSTPLQMMDALKTAARINAELRAQHG